MKNKFNKSEIDTIKKVREILKDDEIDILTIYKYGLYPVSIAAEIMDIDISNINDIYKSLPIKTRTDIDITPMEICSALNIEPSGLINDILTDLEEKIIYKKLENKKDIIVKYLTKTYL